MSSKIKEILAGIQAQIQNLTANSGNNGNFQKLIDDASELIKLSDEVDGKRLKDLRDELYFYEDGGEDNFGLFHRCKAESLTIIAKHVI